MEFTVPRMFKLTSFTTNEKLLVNPDDIVKVKRAERSTSVVYLRDCPSEHVMESVDDIERMMAPPIIEPKSDKRTPQIINSGCGRVGGVG